MRMTYYDEPYKGLCPYYEKDADFFCGREDEILKVKCSLQVYRLTILHGARRCRQDFLSKRWRCASTPSGCESSTSIAGVFPVAVLLSSPRRRMRRPG